MKKVVKTENAAGQRADRRALAEINDLIDDGVHDAASVLAWEVQRTSPGDPAVWLLLARIDYLRERYAAAIYAARMATRLAPSSPDAWFALASTAATRSRWHAEGLDGALQATALAPDRSKNWTVLAQLQLAVGTSYDAAVAAERAVAVDPHYRGGHLMLGEIALHAGEWEHAEAAFRRALVLDPADRDARDGLIEALEAQDRDPDEELARYGAPPPRARQPLARRLVASPTPQEADTGSAPSSGRSTLVVIGSCLLAGLMLGLLVPGLGVIRGFIGAVAVVLMWVAVRPTRGGAPRPGTAADPLAPDPAAASALTTAASDAPDVSDASDASGAPGASANGDEQSVDTHAEIAVPRPGANGASASEGATSGGSTVSRGTVEGQSGDAAEGSGEHLPGDAAEGSGEHLPGDAAEGSGEYLSGDAGDAVGGAGDDGPGDAADGSGEHLPGDAGDAVGGSDATAASDDVVFDMPDDPSELVALIQDRLAAADLELAHAAASRLEAVAPGSVDAHRALGAVALAAHDYEQARTHYREILELEPLDQEAHERLALVGTAAPRSGRRLPLRRLWGRP